MEEWTVEEAETPGKTSVAVAKRVKQNHLSVVG